MIYEKKIHKLLQDLMRNQSAEADLNGSDLFVKIIPDGHKLFISTPVYYGSNYIPKSVRKCLTEQIPFAHLDIKTFLTIDEEQFLIRLNYLGQLIDGEIDQEQLWKLLDTFTWIAEQWRAILEENDRHDLVYIYAKS